MFGIIFLYFKLSWFLLALGFLSSFCLYSTIDGLRYWAGTSLALREDEEVEEEGEGGSIDIGWCPKLIIIAYCCKAFDKGRF